MGSRKRGLNAPDSGGRSAGVCIVGEWNELSTNRDDLRKHIGAAWIQSTRFFQGKTLFITHEQDCAAAIVRVDAMMLKLIRTKGPLFAAREYRRGCFKVTSTKLGKEFLSCLRVEFDVINRTFPHHTFTPHFSLFADAAMHLNVQNFPLGSDNVAIYNTKVEELRVAAKAGAFIKAVENMNRAAAKNAQTAKRLLAHIFRACSTPLIVRVDLYYKWDYHGVLPARIRRHRETFLKHLRSKYPALLGYAWSLEHGNVRGPHTHVLIALNGHKVRTDERIGRLLTKFWNEEASERLGWSHNCNAFKWRYERMGILGIGHVHRDDQAKRAHLLNALLYLAKRDLYLRLAVPGIVKTFSTSYVPPPGAPRKLSRSPPKKMALASQADQPGADPA